MKTVTVVLKGSGYGSTVMIDEQAVEGITGIQIHQTAGGPPRVTLQMTPPVVMVMAETDDIKMVNGMIGKTE